jgi:hypothetical protein
MAKLMDTKNRSSPPYIQQFTKLDSTDNSMVESKDKTKQLSRLPKLAEYFTILATTKVALESLILFVVVLLLIYSND